MSLASDASNVNKSRLLSQVGRVWEVVCAYISMFLQIRVVEMPVFLHYIITAVTWLR